MATKNVSITKQVTTTVETTEQRIVLRLRPDNGQSLAQMKKDNNRIAAFARELGYMPVKVKEVGNS